jgi:hypothetical protein
MLKSLKDKKGQLGFELPYRRRGGFRRGAGRPKKVGAGVPHLRRRSWPRDGRCECDRLCAGKLAVHAARKDRAVHPEAVDALSSAANRNYVASPQTWLLRIGWMGGLPSG